MARSLITPGHAAGQELNMGDVSDVKVLGSWNFTLQDDTPLYWLKCGNLEHYLLRARVRCPCPCSVGMVWHSEAEGSGMEGVSFWMERNQGRRRYFLGGSDLESEPVVTREYMTSETDDGGFWTEEWEVLVQGHTGCVFLQGRKVRLKCRSIRNSGAVAFFNATRPSEEEKMVWSGSTEVHFSHVSLTTLTRGPLTVSGMLAAREKVLAYSISPQEKALQEKLAAQTAPQATTSPASKQQHQIGSAFSAAGSRSRPMSMPTLPRLPAAKQAMGRVLSQEELYQLSKSGESRPLRLLKAAGGGAHQEAKPDPRSQIKFIPALKSMERERRREEMKASLRDSPEKGENFWPLPEAFGIQESPPDPDSRLEEVYKRPIDKLKQEWQQERARAADVDRQMSITFQAIFRLEQRVATLGRTHPAKLRDKMEGKLEELQAQLTELHAYRERVTASLRRIEEDIQRIRDRQRYDAYLDKKVGDHMSNRGQAGLVSEQEDLKDSTKGLAVKREEKALQMGTASGAPRGKGA